MQGGRQIGRAGVFQPNRDQTGSRKVHHSQIFSGGKSKEERIGAGRHWHNMRWRDQHEFFQRLDHPPCKRLAGGSKGEEWRSYVVSEWLWEEH